MANLVDSLKAIKTIPGALGAGLVDTETGMCHAQIGAKSLDLITIGERYAAFMRTHERFFNPLGKDDSLKEIVVTTESHYCIIYPVRIQVLKVKDPESAFFLVVLTKSEIPLAQACRKLAAVVSAFELY